MIGKTRHESADGAVVTVIDGVGPARGILRPAAASGKFWHSRTAPPPSLAPFVEHFWIVRWDLRGQPAHRQESLPHPNVHLIIANGDSRIAGPTTGRFARVLEGCDEVFGVKFRPGGFYPFAKRAIASFADETLALPEVFGDAALTLEAEVRAQSPDDAAMIDVMSRFLLAHLPVFDPAIDTVADIVAGIEWDRASTRVEHLSARHALDKRMLQRLFAKYVGVSPKWVINRYRLHDAVERLQAGNAVDWSQLALELGYFDQAHFIRDFRQMVGETPAQYARSVQDLGHIPVPGQRSLAPPQT